MKVLNRCNWKWFINNSKRLFLGICFVFVLWVYTASYLLSGAGRQITKSDLELYKFRYLIQNDVCAKDLYLLILVHSAANHFEHRNVIRKTWGNPRAGLPPIKVVFLLAMAEDYQSKIEKENLAHRDIIQGNFIDSYHNLTYKHIMGLSWAAANCNRTKYLMKMDDDIFVDIYQLVKYINTRMKIFDFTNNIACYFQTNMPVVRDPVSKWFVSKADFPSDTFDDYCSGWAYLTTTVAAGRLFEAAKSLPYFWVDDVYITGSAAQMANIAHIKINHLFALETDGLSEWTHSSKKLMWEKIFAPTWGDLILAKKAHKKSLLCYTMKCRCCYKRVTTPKPMTTSTTVRGVAQLILI